MDKKQRKGLRKTPALFFVRPAITIKAKPLKQILYDNSLL